MKKLTKKSLDELANEMPVVSEIQQHNCVGGRIYFNYETGAKLGSGIGDDELRLISVNDFNILQNSGMNPAFDTSVSIADERYWSGAREVYQGYLNQYLAAHGTNCLDVAGPDGPATWAWITPTTGTPTSHNVQWERAGGDLSCALNISGGNLNINTNNTATHFESVLLSGIAMVDASGCYHDTQVYTGFVPEWTGVA